MMRNNLIIELVFQEKSHKLPNEFVVEIDDCGSLYTKSLLNIIKKHVEIKKSTAKNIEYGDHLVFVKDDVYVEENNSAVRRLNLPEYSLVQQYESVEKLVNNFFKNVFISKKKNHNTFDFCALCPFATFCPATSKVKDDFIYDGDYVSVDEKVSIFYNFVKVGYDQYDIYLTKSGKERVNIEDETFEIKRDFFGTKYLKLIK